MDGACLPFEEEKFSGPEMYNFFGSQRPKAGCHLFRGEDTALTGSSVFFSSSFKQCLLFPECC